MEKLPNENKQLVYSQLLAQFRDFENPNETNPDLKERDLRIRNALTAMSSIVFLESKGELDEKKKEEMQKDWEESLEVLALDFPKANE